MNIKDLGLKVQRIVHQEEESYNRFMEAAKSHSINQKRGDVVLYIEDDPDQVSMFKTMLACYSTLRLLTAFTAESGRELIKRKSHRVKCIVMDMDLESASVFGGIAAGKQLLEWVSTEYPEIPVVIFTGHSELVAELNEAYPTIEVIVKASDMQNLVHLIESKMRGVA